MHNALILTKHIALALKCMVLRVRQVCPQERPEHLVVVGDLQVQKFVDDDLPLEILTFLGRNLESRRYQPHVCTIEEGVGVNRRMRLVGVSGKLSAVRR